MADNVFFSLWVVNNLGFNGQILNTFPSSLDGLIFNNSFFNFFRNILNLSFDSIVVGDGSFDGDSLGVDDFLVFDDFSLERNSLDSFNSIIFDVFSLERNVLDPALHWDFLSDNFLVSSNNSHR